MPRLMKQGCLNDLLSDLILFCSNSIGNMWACIFLVNDNSRDVLKEGDDFALLHFTDVPFAIEITHNS